MARRDELTAKRFALIEDLLPARGKRGGRGNDHHTTLNGIPWWLYCGAQWREVPARSGKWQSVSDRFNYWRADGTLDRLPAGAAASTPKRGRSFGLRAPARQRAGDPHARRPAGQPAF